MPLCLISNTIKDPHGNPVVNAFIQFDLMPPGAFRTSDNSEVASRYSTTTDSNGYYQVGIEQNANIIPANTYYLITEEIPDYSGGKRFWTIVAPSQASSDVRTALVTPPASPGAFNDCLTRAQADALYAPISAVNTLPPSMAPVNAVLYSNIIP